MGAGEWTPDSQRVIFGSTRTGSSALFWQAADGTGTAQPLGEGEGDANAAGRCAERQRRRSYGGRRREPQPPSRCR